MSLPQVPGFTVSRRLGAGASATVWSATRNADGRAVALKLVAGPGEAGEEDGGPPRQGSTAEQAAREAGVLAGIDHPHVVRLHAATALADGTLTLVLDLVDGGSYAAVVGARGHLHPGEVVTALSPVARAVADLHALGVVHADLSPGNVLFTRQGKPMVSDLGVARLFGEQLELVHATEGFTAPEVALGEEPSPASDVYAIGALAWFGLTGEPPGLPPLRPALSSVVADVPLRLVQLVERCLSAHAGDRPTAASVAVDLFDAAVAEPVQLGDASDPAASITYRIRASARTAAPPQPSRRRARGRFRRRAAPDPALVGPATGPPGAPAQRVRSGRPGPLARGRRETGHPAAVGQVGVPARRARRTQRARGARHPAGAWVLLVVLVALVLGGATGLWVHRAGTRPPEADPAAGAGAGAGSRAPVSTPARTRDLDPAAGVPAVRAELRSSPRVVLQRLADARARAYRSGDPSMLQAVDVAGSPSQVHDEQVIRGAQALGAGYEGLRYVVRSAEVASADGDVATVRARVDTSEHTVVAGDGTRQVRAATAGAPMTIMLRWTAAGWRIHR